MADPNLMALLSLVNIRIPGYTVEEETEGIKNEPDLEPGVYINEVGQSILIRHQETSPTSKLQKLD